MEEKKVNFIILGAQKCGTTSLAYKLSQHPQVCFCERKEPHYFSVSYRKSLDWYHSLFTPEPDQILGEASVRYTLDPVLRDIPSQIKEYNSEMKFIYMMRHPIERILSLYRDFQIRGEKVNRDFLKEVFSRPEYILISRYYAQLKPYLKEFDSGQFLYIDFFEFSENPEKVYKEIAEFLSIDFDQFNLKMEMIKNSSRETLHAQGNLKKFLRSGLIQFFKKFFKTQFIENIKKNLYVKTFTPELTEREYLHIMNFLESDITAIENLTGWNLNSWRKYRGFEFDS